MENGFDCTWDRGSHSRCLFFLVGFGEVNVTVVMEVEFVWVGGLEVLTVLTFLPWSSEGGKASAVLDFELAGLFDSKKRVFFLFLCSFLEFRRRESGMLGKF